VLPRRHQRRHRPDGARGAVDDERGDAVGHRAEPDAPRVHGAPGATAAAADGPEHVLAHGGAVQDAPRGVDQHGVHDVVGGQAELAGQQAEPSAGDVPARADRRARPRGERERRRRAAPARRRRHGVVRLAQRRARLHPRGAGAAVRVDAVERREVDDGERGAAVVVGGVGEALVAVAPAAEAQHEPRRPRAPHGVAELLQRRRDHHGEGLGRARAREAEVLDGDEERGGVRGGLARRDVAHAGGRQARRE